MIISLRHSYRPGQGLYLPRSPRGLVGPATKVAVAVPKRKSLRDSAGRTIRRFALILEYRLSIMGKRSRKDAITDDGLSSSVEIPAQKKSRKDKSKKIELPPATDIVQESKETIVEAGKDTTRFGEKSKHTIEGSSGEESKVSKAERKATKPAKKEAREASSAQNGTPQNVEGASDGLNQDHVDQKALEKAAMKAERKAERKAEKARLRKQMKLERASDTDTANTSIFASKVTSTATSKGQSSATSPEPMPPATSDSKYVEDPALTAVSQAQIDSFLASKFITVNDPLPSALKYRPITDFSYLPITDKAQRTPFASFTSPTPIQAAAWPSLLAGRDMIGVAETGSGKTLAFGVPCTWFISSLPKSQRKGIKAVIVSPTRELALQIHEQLVKLATPAGIEVVCVYGGVPKEPQIQALRSANIVVATPGRLNDLINDGAANLSNAGYVVLDEADRMLDKGFEDDIRKIISCTPWKRQTLMFTATWPPSVRDLAATFMQSPVKITIGDNPFGELRANTRIKQIVEVVEPRNKEYRLLQLLKQHQSGKNKDDRILVFCLYKKEATRVENTIRSKGFRVSGIHGDLSQVQRTASLESFKRGDVPILVATDVAARGLDIPAVKVVINVTFPLTAEDYVHRIGR